MNKIPAEILSAVCGRDSAARIPAEQLAALHFFKGLDEVELEKISAYTMISRFAAGEVILEQGDLANRFYVLLSGRVSIERDFGDRILVVEEIGPGDAV